MNKLVLMLLISLINIYPNTWEKIDIEDTDVAKKITCVDSVTCYLNTSTKLYKTIDKGQNWELIDVYSVFRIKDMNCIDKNNIYLLLDDNEVRYSTNGGKKFYSKFLDSVQSHKYIYMLDSNYGIITNAYMGDNLYYFLTTQDNWSTFEINSIEPAVDLKRKNIFYSYNNINKIDSETLIINTVFYDRNKETETPFIMKLNLINKSLELIQQRKEFFAFEEIKIINDSLYFQCEKTNTIQGGSGHDAIFKSTDAGNSWRKVLDLYTSRNKFNQSPFGLQQIAFKNDSVGIAVGQFGKIVYTYDGGESWIYETKLPPYLGGGESNPPTMVIEYAGDTPIIGAFNGTIHIMTEDTYAPKPEDTLTISGRVALNGVGLEGVAVSLNTYRITMTDENGFYKFRKLPIGNHIVKAINKYLDHGPHTDNFYEPFSFSSEYNLNLTSDTTNIDFEATDNRNFYSLSGSVTLDNKGLEDIVMQFGSNTVTTNEDGYFIFDSLEQRRHNLTPITEGYTYEPEFYDITLNEHIASMNFVASPITSVKSNPNFEFKNNILYCKEIVGLIYRLIDLQGRVIKSSNLSPTIDFNYLDNGTYILQVTKNNSEVFSEKFQVVR